jgi:hypothetical protein
MATSYERGWPIVFDCDAGVWRYVDTGEECTGERSCTRCGQPPTAEGHDACIGNLDWCVAACCGHGVEKPYEMKEPSKAMSYLFKIVDAWPSPRQAARSILVLRFWAARGDRPYYTSIKFTTIREESSK